MPHGAGQLSSLRYNLPQRFLTLALVLATTPVRPEYGDVVLNERSDLEGVRPVVFPHWFHRIRHQCRVCHTELGFEMKTGASGMGMDQISRGAFCGACHNGDIAWSVDNCDFCHAGVPGTATGVRASHRTLGPGEY